MARIPKMGMQWDMLQHVSLACVDDVKRHHHIEGAHEAIYEENKGIGGVSVENHLKEDSLVPGGVSVSFCYADCADVWLF